MFCQGAREGLGGRGGARGVRLCRQVLERPTRRRHRVSIHEENDAEISI